MWKVTNFQKLVENHFRKKPVRRLWHKKQADRSQAADNAPSSEMNSRLSFYDLVGAGEQRRRQVDVKRPGGFEIDDEFQPSGLLNGEITGLLAL